ncbi:MAG: hypothetical protein IBX55_12065 [Methyloprofundus sp.]|nr:hypothetical protein [Methyloprofundus sp.]
MKKSKSRLLSASASVILVALTSGSVHAADGVFDMHYTSVTQEISSGTQGKVELQSSGLAFQVREFDTFASNGKLNVGASIGFNFGAELGDMHINLSLMPSYHINKDANVYIKAGITTTDAPSARTSPGAYGVGGHYFFTKKLGVSAEYGTLYKSKIYNTTAFNIGLTYRM